MSVDAEHEARLRENRKEWLRDQRDRLRASLATFRGQTVVLELHDGRRLSATIADVSEDEIQIIDQGDARVPPPKPLAMIPLADIRFARTP